MSFYSNKIYNSYLLWDDVWKANKYLYFEKLHKNLFIKSYIRNFFNFYIPYFIKFELRTFSFLTLEHRKAARSFYKQIADTFFLDQISIHDSIFKHNYSVIVNIFDITRIKIKKKKRRPKAKWVAKFFQLVRRKNPISFNLLDRSIVKRRFRKRFVKVINFLLDIGGARSSGFNFVDFFLGWRLSKVKVKIKPKRVIRRIFKGHRIIFTNLKSSRRRILKKYKAKAFKKRKLLFTAGRGLILHQLKRILFSRKYYPLFSRFLKYNSIEPETAKEEESTNKVTKHTPVAAITVAKSKFIDFIYSQFSHRFIEWVRQHLKKRLAKKLRHFVFKKFYLNFLFRVHLFLFEFFKRRNIVRRLISKLYKYYAKGRYRKVYLFREIKILNKLLKRRRRKNKINLVKYKSQLVKRQRKRATRRIIFAYDSKHKRFYITFSFVHYYIFKFLFYFIQRLFKEHFVKFKINYILSPTAFVLSQYIATYLKKKFTVNKVIYSFLPLIRKQHPDIVGLRIRCAGRLTRRARKSVRVYSIGCLKKSNMLNRVDYSESTVILKYGIVSIKVWLLKRKFRKRRLNYVGKYKIREVKNI